jgi:hypothetical protein
MSFSQGAEIAFCSGPRNKDEMEQKIINLYDEFTQGGMNRREFLERL